MGVEAVVCFVCTTLSPATNAPTTKGSFQAISSPASNFIYLLIYFFIRERERLLSRLHAQHRAQCRAQPPSPGIMTWVQSRCLAHWATKVPLPCFQFVWRCHAFPGQCLAVPDMGHKFLTWMRPLFSICPWELSLASQFVQCMRQRYTHHERRSHSRNAVMMT